MTDNDTPRSNGSPPSFQGINFDRELLFLAFFFTVFLFLLYQLSLILSPFLAPLFGAFMLTVIFYSLHSRLVKYIRNSTITAGISTIIVIITIVVPVFFLIWILVIEAADLIPLVREWVEEWEQRGADRPGGAIPAPLLELWRKIFPYIERWEVDLQSMATETVRNLGNSITSIGAATLRGSFNFILNTIILVIVLFYFFRDGERIINSILDLVPMEKKNKELILTRLDRTFVAAIRGTFITAAAQGILTGIGLGVAGVPFAVLLGFTAAVCSVVPFVGTTLVWVPASIYLVLDDRMLAGIGLFVWGVVVVGLIDNLLRPWVVGKDAHLPVLLLFIGILGGLEVYGLSSILVSPLIVAAVLVFAQIYHDQYLSGHHEKMPEDNRANP